MERAPGAARTRLARVRDGMGKNALCSPLFRLPLNAFAMQKFGQRPVTLREVVLLSKLALIGIVGLACASPALGFNDPADRGDTTLTQSVGTQAVGSPDVTGCHASRPQLSPEERARRKAMRAQKAAARTTNGLPAKASRPHTPRC